METGSASAATPKGMYWTGWVLSALPTAMFVFGGAMAVSGAKQAAEGFEKYGYPHGTWAILGVIEIVCALIYIVPQTAVLGAILLTGYLGGAVATHVRASESEWYFAVIFGIIVWGGLFLRDARIRALIPLRK